MVPIVWKLRARRAKPLARRGLRLLGLRSSKLEEDIVGRDLEVTPRFKRRTPTADIPRNKVHSRFSDGVDISYEGF
jgi:hypothetical protein